jgi:hypothetical protein
VEARDVTDQDVRNPSRGGGATTGTGSSFGRATIFPPSSRILQIIATHHSGAHKCTTPHGEWSANRRRRWCCDRDFATSDIAAAVLQLHTELTTQRPPTLVSSPCKFAWLPRTRFTSSSTAISARLRRHWPETKGLSGRRNASLEASLSETGLARSSCLTNMSSTCATL